jgi:gas vesicle structural protein
MAMTVIPSTGSAVTPSGGNISDVVGLILDKGLVIDAYVRVSLIGIEVLTIDARVVVASVDTYLRFAEAAGRLNLEATRKPGLPELIMGVAGARSRAAASVGRAQEAAALSAAPEAGAELHDGHDKDVAAKSAKREKERTR